MYCIKRFLDIVGALVASFIAIPLFALGVICVKIFSPGSPALFQQARIGYRGSLFTIYKLRSMTNDRDDRGDLLPAEARLKTWGKIIRASNIDELPQIVNILRGEMSWIGPRPLLPDEMFVMDEEEQELRQSLLPGITGWEAVNEGKSETRRQMVEFDLFYVRNWSLWFDVKIFFITAFIVLLKLRPGDSVRAPKLLNVEMMNQKKEDVPK